MTAQMDAGLPPPAMVINAEGRSPFVLACEHASNRIPETYAGLGLSTLHRLTHVAWDLGALAVAYQLADRLDAPLVQSTVSRLVIDCNRGFDAPDLIPTISEHTEIPGNEHLDVLERAQRIVAYHNPFHEAVTALLDRRAALGLETIFVTLHSFTPVYKGVARPWPVGVIHGLDEQFTRLFYEALRREDPQLNVGWNEPYAALVGVTYTLEHHGDRRGLESTMIEIRHDEILEPSGVAFWAARLARCLEQARLNLRNENPSLPADTKLPTGGADGN